MRRIRESDVPMLPSILKEGAKYKKLFSMTFAMLSLIILMKNTTNTIRIGYFNYKTKI
jgi:hypothetical protein